MIIKLPKSLQNIQLPNNYETILSSNIDIVPSILSIIGVKNDPKDYSNGKNLFDKDYKRDYVFVSNWNNNAIITDKKTYLFSNLPNKMFKNEIRDSNSYKKIKNSKVDSKLILDVMNHNRQFLE